MTTIHLNSSNYNLRIEIPQWNKASKLVVALGFEPQTSWAREECSARSATLDPEFFNILVIQTVSQNLQVEKKMSVLSIKDLEQWSL